MWTSPKKVSCRLSNMISAHQKFYELIIKTELEGDTDLDLKNFYNRIKICTYAVTRIQEDLLSGYQSIKMHSYFEEYFIPDHSHPLYYWNAQT